MHTIQTNGTYISQEWLDFFRENNIAVSISIDGPKFLHDKNRRSWNDKSTFDLTLRGVRLLRENEIPLVGLCVLSIESLKYPREILEFFIEEGFSKLGLIVEEPWGGNSNTTFSDMETFLKFPYH